MEIDQYAEERDRKRVIENGKTRKGGQALARINRSIHAYRHEYKSLTTEKSQQKDRATVSTITLPSTLKESHSIALYLEYFLIGLSREFVFCFFCILASFW